MPLSVCAWRKPVTRRGEDPRGRRSATPAPTGRSAGNCFDVLRASSNPVERAALDVVG